MRATTESERRMAERKRTTKKTGQSKGRHRNLSKVTASVALAGATIPVAAAAATAINLATATPAAASSCTHTGHAIYGPNFNTPSYTITGHCGYGAGYTWANVYAKHATVPQEIRAWWFNDHCGSGGIGSCWVEDGPKPVADNSTWVELITELYDNSTFHLQGSKSASVVAVY
jgi:hypothetical protein